MRCPFLKQTRVRYCELSPIRKMLTDTDDFELHERCSSSQYRDCPLLKNADPYPHDRGDEGHCPRLRSAFVQYCDTAGMRKFVPYQDCLLSRCQTDSHLYCPVYRQRAHPHQPGEGVHSGAEETVLVPEHLCYWPNHMWIHEGEYGLCHIGVDAFVSCVLGSIDRVQLISPRTLTHPTAVLTVNGHEVRFVFPEKLELTGSNVHLLTHPEAILEDPYGNGWLYEGRRIQVESLSAVDRGSIEAGDNRQWMQEELQRLDSFVRKSVPAGAPSEISLATDGGRTVTGLAAHLGHEEGLELMRRFFSFPLEEE